VYLYVVIWLSELRHSINTNKLLYFFHCMLGYKFGVHLPPPARTPHPAPRTPHPAPRTPHPAPRTPHPAPHNYI
jgi:hypothetical protein